MENSERILFEDDSPHWYIAVGNQGVGPMRASEVYEKILANEISWAHFVWKKGQPEWKRIYEVRAFQVVLPRQPARTVQKAVLESTRSIVNPMSRPAVQTKKWYLHLNQTQYGPFSDDEIARFIKLGKVDSKTYVWCEGMPNWARLEQVPTLNRSSGNAPPPRSPSPPPVQKSLDKREGPRRPLVAKILISNDQSVIVGVCRDISIGGLQILTEKIPGPVGQKLKMNISPSSNDIGKPVEPFVAEGEVVRILEDGRGFSFRFEKLSQQAKNAIESYIESPV